MSAIKDTTTRLRRSFHYPHGDDDDAANSQPEAMDEEEQESLIRQLAQQNASRNAQFRFALLALTVLAAVPFIPAFFRTRTRLLSLLSLTSLGSTAYVLHRLPPGVTGIEPLDAWVSGSSGHQQKAPRQHMPPLHRYLPCLNVALCALSLLLGLALGGDAALGLAGLGLGHLPGLIFFVVLLAKTVMGGVDPERELSTLKYGFKGA